MPLGTPSCRDDNAISFMNRLNMIDPIDLGINQQ